MNNKNIGENPSETISLKKVRLFVCEKPYQLKHTSKALNKSGKLSENDFFIIAPSICSFKFSYPKIMKLKDAPYINLDPEYKCLFAEYGQYGNVYDRNGKLVDNELSNLLSEYHFVVSRKYVFEDKMREIKSKIIDYFQTNISDVISFCDFDYTGARGFKFHFEKYYNLASLELFEKAYGINVSVARFIAMDEKSIVKSLESKLDYMNDSCIYLRDYYNKKDFIDYNFNINSMLYIGNTLRDSGIYLDGFITRNMLYTLLIILESEKITEDRLLSKMDKNNIGSNASRIAIVEELYDYNFIEKVITGIKQKKSYIRLSEQCQSFISNLHPSLKSYKVASKFYKMNKELCVKDFKLEVGKYLKNVFEKQDRFLAAK